MTPRRLLLLLLAVVLIAGGVTLAVVALSDDPPPPPKATGEKAPDGLARFYDQKLEWTDCEQARCTWVRVPVDYEKPDGATLRLRVKSFAATGDGRKVLFVNPGGPGGSAVDFAGTMAQSLGKDVRDQYAVVGVDPRGVGLSTPVRCLSDTAFDRYVASDPSPDDAAEEREAVEQGRRFGEACAKNTPNDLAGHVSTAEAARDMDVVRALLGQRRLDWFGASYGTQLGATYATLFPTKVGRMVLDGATDPSAGPIDSSLGQAKGFQSALEAYVRSCVRQASCPLGRDADAGLDRIAAFVDGLDEKPLATGTDRKLTEGRAFYGIAVTLYNQQNWPTLTQALQKAFAGDGSALLQLNDFYFDRQPDGRFKSNSGQVIGAVSCDDTKDRPTLAQVVKELPRFEKASPVFGRALGFGAASCATWPLPATTPQPALDAKGSPPIVVIGTTNDPATPYAYAGKMAKALGTGVLVTREGEGHTAYLSGNQCIKTLVDRFFADGDVPKNGTTCKNGS
ncbi:MAG: alpha/beta hydrolase [Aeromicrobium erythreum]